LQPLDVQLELLIGAGGDLITRRGGAEVARISLKGFSAVTAYLRWIAARQDYAVLPRGWPVPNAASETSVTQPDSWNSPMPQPQVLAPGYASDFGIAPATSAAPLTVPPQPSVGATITGTAVWLGQPGAMQPAPPAYGTTVGNALNTEALRNELADLKALVVVAQDSGGRVSSTRDTILAHQDVAQGNVALQQVDVAQLLSVLEELQAQVSALQNTQPDVAAVPWGAGTDDQLRSASEVPVMGPQGSTDMSHDAERLAYGVKNLGYDAQTALAILKSSPEAQPGNELAVGVSPQGDTGGLRAFCMKMRWSTRY